MIHFFFPSVLVLYVALSSLGFVNRAHGQNFDPPTPDCQLNINCETAHWRVERNGTVFINSYFRNRQGGGYDYYWQPCSGTLLNYENVNQMGGVNKLYILTSAHCLRYDGTQEVNDPSAYDDHLNNFFTRPN